MDRRQQRAVYERAQTIFSATAVTHPVERGARVLEEALEAAQAFGVPLPMVLKLVARCYERPPGRTHDELAQVVLVCMAAAECDDFDLAKVLEQHINGFFKPTQERLDKWHRNERDKLAAGISVPRGTLLAGIDNGPEDRSDE